MAKAALRIATNYELLNKSELSPLQLEYLLKALNFSRPNTQIQSLIYKNLGTFYFQANEFTKALDYYTKSNLISPNPTIDYAIAVSYLKLSDYLNYEKYLHKAVSVISPYNISPFKTYGQLLELSKKDYQGAAKYYKIATLLKNNPGPYILLARVYLIQSKINKASNVISKGLNSFPENPTLTYLNGTVLLNKGRLNAGISKLKDVVSNKNSPDDIREEACNILKERNVVVDCKW